MLTIRLFQAKRRHKGDEGVCKRLTSSVVSSAVEAECGVGPGKLASCVS